MAQLMDLNNLYAVYGFDFKVSSNSDYVYFVIEIDMGRNYKYLSLISPYHEKDKMHKYV